MRRVATHVLSSKSGIAWNEIGTTAPRHRWVCLLSVSVSPRSLHSTASRTLQQQASTHTAASSNTATQSPARQTSGHNTGTASASSAPSPSSSAASTQDGPISVTAVATPLSRKAATAPSSAPSPLRLLRVPDLELGEARLSKWLVQPAQPFSADCVLAELDTDMAVIEYKADRPGWLAVHAVGEGEEVHVDQPIAVACDREDEVARVSKEWMDKVERKEREREQRAERPAHSLSEEVAKMKE